MITELPESQGAFLGFEIASKVTLEEEKAWIARIEQSLNDHDRINVLAVLDKGAGWGVQAGIEDLKWIMKHMNRINKIAIVSDSATIKWLIAVDSQFARLAGIGEKYFDTAHLADAWSWIKE